jgi:hypothetical protein
MRDDVASAPPVNQHQSVRSISATQQNPYRYVDRQPLVTTFARGAMKLNLERQIRFSRESEHSSLYQWSLNELSPSGERLDRDLIPWDWTLRFVASDLRLHSSYQLKRAFREDRTVGTERLISEALVARLRLDAAFSSESRWSLTTLSMLGTEREVSAISLRVESLASEDEGERCTLWGCPSYTTEIDFHDRTFPDTLQIQLSVAPSRFRDLCALTTRPHPILLSVMVSEVSGFYSDWSPAIGTDRVKILTGNDAHVVESAPGTDMALPRLGEVGEFTLELAQHAAVHAPSAVVETDEDTSDVEAPHTVVAVTTPEVDAAQKLLLELSHTRRAVAAMRTPVWIAVVLLGLLLLLQ